MKGLRRSVEWIQLTRIVVFSQACMLHGKELGLAGFELLFFADGCDSLALLGGHAAQVWSLVFELHSLA